MSSEIKEIALVPKIASVSFNWDVKLESCIELFLEQQLRGIVLFNNRLII